MANPIPESKPARRTFNTPNAAGVSRDTNDRSSSDQRPKGQPAGSTFKRRDANGTTACTTANRRQTPSQEVGAKGSLPPVQPDAHQPWRAIKRKPSL